MKLFLGSLSQSYPTHPLCEIVGLIDTDVRLDIDDEA